MDDESFLREIAAAPGDVHLRMVYADWLEEQGDPRAAFLRAEADLRSAPPGDPSCRGLARVLRELRSKADPGWLGRIEPEPPVPGWLPAEARRPPRAGVVDWYRWMSRSHFEFVVMAVLGPIDAVARALIEHRMGTDPDSALASRRWDRDVPIRRTGRTGDRVSWPIPIVQLKGHAWTIAIYSTFSLTLPAYHSAQSDAFGLSGHLGTMAVEFSHEGTSWATGYHLFDCGELVESVEWSGVDGRYASKRRPDLPWPVPPRDFADDLFRTLGLYVPGCHAVEFRGRPCLKYDGPADSEVERADLLDLRGSFAELSSEQSASFSEIEPTHTWEDDIPF